MENAINSISDLLDNDKSLNNSKILKVTDIMGELYDDLVPLFGRSDDNLKLISKTLRDITFNITQL